MTSKEMVVKDEVKVLVLAELCNPEWASVPLVGWKQVNSLSHRCQLTLCTHLTNQENIGRANADFEVLYTVNPILDKIFTWVIRKFFNNEYGSATITFLKIPCYFCYELKVALSVAKRLRRGEWQVVHRITPVSPVLSSPIAIFCGILRIPFVLGPLNGGLPWPKGYEESIKEKSLLSNVRFLYRLDPLGYITRSLSSKIIVASQFTLSEFSKENQKKCIYISENGIEREKLIPEAEIKSPGTVLKCVFIGRLVALKNPSIAAEAVRELVESNQATLDFFGDGTEGPKLKKNYSHQGYTYHGWISSQAKLLEELSQFNILIFPSVKEFGGGVVIEAMAKGIVPIVMNYGGPSEIVNDDSGYRISLTNQQQTTTDIANLVSYLKSHPQEVKAKAEKAVARIREHYTWEAKADEFIRIYQEIIDGKN